MSRLGQLLGWVYKKKKIFLVVLVSIIVIDLLYLLILWPDWDAINSGSIPESNLIREYREDVADKNFGGRVFQFT